MPHPSPFSFRYPSRTVLTLSAILCAYGLFSPTFEGDRRFGAHSCFVVLRRRAKPQLKRTSRVACSTFTPLAAV
eukprot:scaffold241_cov340-Pavlova_lutheri.AAC.21